MPQERPSIIEVSDRLGPEEATRVLAVLDGSDPAVAVVIDVRAVAEFESHVVVRVAHALAVREGKGSFIGLPRHQAQILRYIGVNVGLK